MTRAAAAAGGAERSPDVGAVPGARQGLERRAAPRADQDRSVVPAAVRGDRRAAAGRPRWSACATCRTDLLRTLKRAGFGDQRARRDDPRRRARPRSASSRLELKLVPAFKRIDTCAAEFESFTPYLYSSYERRLRGGADRQAEDHHPRQRPQPHRAGHRVRLLLLSRRVRLPRRRASRR